ncbi:MAG: GNAT family N-acetyltransferase [Candidatus Pacebacteria bacterium]|nr:GNAT family N-acetyltransferase [Candidatus Paceibacterota bacterium]
MNNGIKLVPVDRSHQPLISRWFVDDLAGQKELNSYMNLESWMKLLDSANRWGWIAYEGDEAVGFLDLEKSLDGKGNFSFYVEPNHRGQHKSGQVLAALTNQARKLGIEQLEAGVEELNIASQKALRSANFIENGRDKDNYIVFQLIL